jgi:hypothetical protein
LTGSLTLTTGVQARAADRSISDSLEGTVIWEYFFIMYFGYLLQPPPPLCELARPAEWGFVYMVITGQQNKEYFIVLRCYDS